jgi:hypothetical protein
MNVYRILAGIYFGKHTLKEPKRRWKDSTEGCFGEISLEIGGRFRDVPKGGLLR